MPQKEKSADAVDRRVKQSGSTFKRMPTSCA